MISCLYYTALKTKYVYLEDVFVTGILARSCGYKVRLQKILPCYYLILLKHYT